MNIHQFKHRERVKEKELAHGSFKLKDQTLQDRLNRQYENDAKILDCEAFAKKPVKRMSLP